MRVSRDRDSGAPSTGRSATDGGGGIPGKQTLVEQAYTALPVAVAVPQHDGEPQGAQGRADLQQTQQPAKTEGGPVPPSSAPDAHSNGASDAPTESYVIPFDRNPLSAPGERIIFGATYTDPKPADYQLVYTSVGGDFNAAGSGTTSVTYPGISQRNINFYIDAKWDKKTAVTVKLELQKVSDKSVVKTVNWTFGAKTTVPTTVTQQEPETEVALPGSYSYKCGPDIGGDGKDDYLHQTILEEFTTRTSNLTLAEIKPDYAKANGLTTDQQVTDHFFGTSSNNGTFTVSAGDRFYDQHNGGMPDKATFEAALVKMKEIYVDLPQTYSAEPGKPLGKYTVRRILTTGGAKKVKKWKT